MDFQATGVDAAGFSTMEDDFKAMLASQLGLSLGQIELSATPFRRMLQDQLQFQFYVKINAQEADMAAINAAIANPSSLNLNTIASGVTFDLTGSQIDRTSMSCPVGFVEMQGQTSDSSWVTYADGIDACAQACDLQTPNHQNLPPRDCNSFQYSPSVNANGWGQCWRFADADPEDTSSNRGPDFVFCSRQPTEVDASSTKTLSNLGDGRCAVNGVMVDLMGYTLRTSHDDCLNACEADSDCVAAMPAYDYYCQLYKTADVVGEIDSVDASQLQWSCYVREDPDNVVLMDFQANGVDAAGFSALEDDFKAMLASQLGLSLGQIELSATPFRRMLQDQLQFQFYVKINAQEVDMAAINAAIANPSSLNLNTIASGVTFDLTGSQIDRTSMYDNCQWTAYGAPGMLDCSEPEDYIQTNLQDCQAQAVDVGANAIQFLDNYCRFKTCDTPGDVNDLTGSGVELRWQSYYCAPDQEEPTTTCPLGFVEMQGQTSDSSWVTYADGIDACA